MFPESFSQGLPIGFGSLARWETFLPTIINPKSPNPANLTVLTEGIIKGALNNRERLLPFSYSDEMTFLAKFDGGGEIDCSGGVISAKNGVKIEIPAGAVSNNILITIQNANLDVSLPEEVQQAGQVFNFGPEGTIFKADINITLPYLDSDNNGIIDGRDISVDNLAGMTYDTEMQRWLYMKKVSISKDNKTVTFAPDHFSGKIPVGLKLTPYGSQKISIFTIDGLSLEKLYDLPQMFNLNYRPSYLRKGILQMELGLNENDMYSFGSGNGEDSWNGQAYLTPFVSPNVLKSMSSEYNKAKSFKDPKKFILITHSWGNILAYLSLQFCPDLIPDLVISLSSPMPSDNVKIDLSDPCYGPIPVGVVEDIKWGFVTAESA